MKYSKALYNRLPHYLQILKTNFEGSVFVSSSQLASALDLGEVQVRKDLALVSGAGKPKVGYNREELISHLVQTLDCQREKKAVIVGCGKLGQALLAYGGFKEFNIVITAGFDIAPPQESGKKIFPLEKLKEYCKEEKIEIGIIATPAHAAQSVCDELTKAGVKGIWSFAPTKLKTEDGIALKEENMAAALAVLAARIK